VKKKKTKNTHTIQKQNKGIKRLKELKRKKEEKPGTKSREMIKKLVPLFSCFFVLMGWESKFSTRIVLIWS